MAHRFHVTHEAEFYTEGMKIRTEVTGPFPENLLEPERIYIVAGSSTEYVVSEDEELGRNIAYELAKTRAAAQRNAFMVVAQQIEDRVKAGTEIIEKHIAERSNGEKQS